MNLSRKHIDLLAATLTMTAVVVVMFMVFLRGPDGIGALTDTEATSIAEESGLADSLRYDSSQISPHGNLPLQSEGPAGEVSQIPRGLPQMNGTTCPEPTRLLSNGDFNGTRFTLGYYPSFSSEDRGKLNSPDYSYTVTGGPPTMFVRIEYSRQWGVNYDGVSATQASVLSVPHVGWEVTSSDFNSNPVPFSAVAPYPQSVSITVNVTGPGCGSLNGTSYRFTRGGVFGATRYRHTPQPTPNPLYTCPTSSSKYVAISYFRGSTLRVSLVAGISQGLYNNVSENDVDDMFPGSPSSLSVEINYGGTTETVNVPFLSYGKSRTGRYNGLTFVPSGWAVTKRFRTSISESRDPRSARVSATVSYCDGTSTSGSDYENYPYPADRSPPPTPLPAPIAASAIEITSSPAAHSTYAIGEELEVKVSFGEDITIATSSPPSLRLTMDSGSVTMAYDRLVSNRDLYFTHTVAEGNSDETGVAIPENPVSGNVYLGGKKRRPRHAGLQSDAAHRVDGVRPTITTLQFDPSVFSALKSADTHYQIDLLATFSEDVNVAGDPEIGITVNGTAQTSAYDGASGLMLNKRFGYQHPRSTDSSETSTTTSVAVPAGSVALDSNDTIRDQVGNDAVLIYSALRATSMTAFDRTGPALEGLSIVGATNRYGWLRLCQVKRSGQLQFFQGCQRLNDRSNGQGFVDIVAQFDEALDSAAHNNAGLDVLLDGGSTSETEVALNSSISQDATAGRIKFKYYVKAGEDAPGGISVPAGVLDCLGTCQDESANYSTAAELTHVGLPVQPQYRVDGVAPTITGLEMLSEAPGREGWYGIDDTVRVGMRFSEPVLVGSYGRSNGGTANVFIPNFGGNLKLPLVLDTAAETTTELLRRPGDIMGEVHDFRYQVREGDNDPTGISVEANTLIRTQIGSNSLGNNQKAVIHDIAYNHLCDGGVSNWLIGLNPGGPLGGDYEECEGGQDQHTALAAQIDHKIDGTRPVLESVEFANTPADDDGYAIDEAIQVTATFSEPVWVAGSPVINLQVGNDLKTMNYFAPYRISATGTVEYLDIGTTTLSFVYTVEEGDEDTDGIAIPANAFNRMGALIDDVARNEVLDAGIAHDAVDTDDTRLVDGIRATIESARFISTPSATSSSADTYIGGDEVAVEVTFSEPVDTNFNAVMYLMMALADTSTTTRPMVADGVTSTTTVVFRYTITDTDLGTSLKISENPFALFAALNIVDKVAFVDFISV